MTKNEKLLMAGGLVALFWLRKQKVGTWPSMIIDTGTRDILGNEPSMIIDTGRRDILGDVVKRRRTLRRRL